MGWYPLPLDAGWRQGGYLSAVARPISKANGKMVGKLAHFFDDPSPAWRSKRTQPRQELSQLGLHVFYQRAVTLVPPHGAVSERTPPRCRAPPGSWRGQVPQP
jgi:hypothetical protein